MGVSGIFLWTILGLDHGICVLTLQNGPEQAYTEERLRCKKNEGLGKKVVNLS